MLRAQWGDLHLPLSKLAAAKQRRNDVLAPLERKYTTQSPQLHPLFMEGLGIGDICFLRTAEKVVQGNVPPPQMESQRQLYLCEQGQEALHLFGE